MQGNKQETKHFPKAQGILHDCLRILGNQNVHRVKHSVIRRKHGQAIGSIEVEVLLDNIGTVFKIHTTATDAKFISFPNTRFATENKFGCIVIDVITLRDGIWVEKIGDFAKSQPDQSIEMDINFQPVDDAELWED